jgi:hypothetical protein
LGRRLCFWCWARRYSAVASVWWTTARLLTSMPNHSHTLDRIASWWKSSLYVLSWYMFIPVWRLQHDRVGFFLTPELLAQNDDFHDYAVASGRISYRVFRGVVDFAVTKEIMSLLFWCFWVCASPKRVTLISFRIRQGRGCKVHNSCLQVLLSISRVGKKTESWEQWEARWRMYHT